MLLLMIVLVSRNNGMRNETSTCRCDYPFRLLFVLEGSASQLCYQS